MVFIGYMKIKIKLNKIDTREQKVKFTKNLIKKPTLKMICMFQKFEYVKLDFILFSVWSIFEQFESAIFLTVIFCIPSDEKPEFHNRVSASGVGYCSIS